MSLTAWRIVKAQQAHQAFSGAGARLYGGRWNPRGIGVVYTAGSLALAALEVLVHLEGAQRMESYVQIPVEFDASLCLNLDLHSLPSDWADNPAPVSTQALGREWVEAEISAVLGVPSAIVPDEMVYLLNPGHADFAGVEMGRPDSFRFDRRLLKR